MAEGTIGEVTLFAANFAPRNWAFCQGQILPINTNQALFSILGTTYGGDGRTSFGLPDYRGRVPLGLRQGSGLPNYNGGERGGVQTVTLNQTQIPAHSHAQGAGNLTATLRANAGVMMGDQTAPGASNVLASVPNTNMYSSSDGALVAIDGTSMTSTIGNAGSSQAHQNRQPLLGLNYIICLQGLFPSRN